MIKFDVAPGVHALVHGYTNSYVVEGEGGITLVDAGYPVDVAHARVLSDPAVPLRGQRSGV